MQLKSRMFVLACSLALASIAAAAEAPHYSSLYVFGDSYCDVGNSYTFFHGSPPPPYYEGRFSNGPLWVDHIAGFLGVPLTASSLGGTDYAFSGAAVTVNSPIPPSISQQIDQYLAEHAGKADPDALFLIEGGTNDILHTSFHDPEQIGYQVALGLANGEQRLRQAGARHFLMPNLFDVGSLPAAGQRAGLDSAATFATNRWLDVLLSADQRREGAHVLRLDLFSVVEAIRKDPTHFGLVNLTDRCFTTTLCADPDRWFFFDDAHPSEFAQSYFAVAVEAILARAGS